MSQYTVEQFASELNLPVDLLLDQLKNAGVKKSDSKDELSEEDKSALLNFLKQSHGDSQKPKNKITLTRKQNTEIKKTDSTGRSRTIQVEVRKKRTLIKTPEEQKTETEVIAPKVILDDEQQKIRDQEKARHDALMKAQADDKQKAEEKKQEPKKHIDGTIHKPENKEIKKETKSDWEDAPKKKVIKTRNSNPVPDGWRPPKSRHKKYNQTKHTSDAETTFVAPTEPLIIDPVSNTTIWLVDISANRPYKDRFQDNNHIEVELDQWPARARWVLRDIDLSAAQDISRHMIRARAYDRANIEVSHDVSDTVRMISAHPGTVFELQLALSVPWTQESIIWLFSDGSMGTVTKSDIQSLLNKSAECMMAAKAWAVQAMALVDAAGSVEQLRQIMRNLDLWEDVK